MVVRDPCGGVETVKAIQGALERGKQGQLEIPVTGAIRALLALARLGEPGLL